MTKILEAAADETSNSAVKNADITSKSGDTETGHQQESSTTVQPELETTQPTEALELPLDVTFELLRNQRRRYVLQYLDGSEKKVSLSELAEQIAAWENGKPIRQITSSERKRVYVGLYQCHLPKMDGMGVISFNKPRGVIERGKHADAVDPYVKRAAAPEQESLIGPLLGLSIVGATMVPLAITMLSQSTISLAVAALIVCIATAWGVAVLRREGSDNHASPDNPKSS